MSRTTTNFAQYSYVAMSNYAYGWALLLSNNSKSRTWLVAHRLLALIWVIEKAAVWPLALWPYGLMALVKMPCRMKIQWFSRQLESSVEMGSSWFYVWVVFVDEGHEGRQSLSSYIVQARAVFIQRTLWWQISENWSGDDAGHTGSSSTPEPPSMY